MQKYRFYINGPIGLALQRTFQTRGANAQNAKKNKTPPKNMMDQYVKHSI